MRARLSYKVFIMKMQTYANNILIVPADKGRVTIVMDKTDYYDKMDSLVNDIQGIRRTETKTLDFLVTRDNNDNKLSTTVYRKPTHTDRLLDQSSYNPTSYKARTIQILTRRAQLVCDPPGSLSDKNNYSDNVFNKNNYEKDFVRCNTYKDTESNVTNNDATPVTTVTTVEPVYNGPVLSGHPLLSGQFLKSRFFARTNAVFVTCITRPPLLSGHGHPVAVPCLSFFVIFTCIKRPPLKLSHMHSTMDNRNCRWQCRQSTTCFTNKSFKFRGAKRTCPTCLSRCNSYPIPILT